MLTDEQKLQRRSGLGGSDIATILGLNPYRTPYELYCDKVDGLTIEENEAMYWGNALEEPIAKRYEELTGTVLNQSVTVCHQLKPFFLANPDRLINDTRKGLEIKTVGPRSAHLWGETGSKIIPEHYYPQIMHYLFVLDYESWDVAALINGQELRLYTFERDHDFDEIIDREGTKFWKGYIEPKLPPPISYSDPKTLRLIKMKYKDVQPKSVEMFHMEPWRQIYVEAKQKMKELNAVMDDATAHILDAMGEAEKGEFDDGSYFLRKEISVKGYTVQPKKYISFGYKKAKENADDGNTGE